MNENLVFDSIPFNFDFDIFSKKINLESYQNMEDEVKCFLNKIVSKVRPKALYREAYIDEKINNVVIIEGVTFKSPILKDNLNNIGRVFPFIASCGNELEKIQRDIKDPLKHYWIDMLKEMSLASATQYLNKYIKDKYKIDKISSMNPGSADKEVWPLSQQQQLFSLFDNVEELIGVKLTDSHLMIPNKSVSGIYFPAAEEFINCEFCTREDCPSRKAPHNPDKW